MHPQPHLDVWVLHIELNSGRSDVGKYIGWKPELEVSKAGLTLTPSEPLIVSTRSVGIVITAVISLVVGSHTRDRLRVCQKFLT
jgi:hypothetical protein